MPPSLPDSHRLALDRLVSTLDDHDVAWALTGSTGMALQGVPVEPNDIDVQTTEPGAYAIEEAFADEVTRPVEFRAAERIRSHFGAVELDGVRVEIIGALERRQPDGTWEPADAIPRHRTTVDLDGQPTPVIELAYEVRAYERLGRVDRAALVRDHLDGGSQTASTDADSPT